MNDGDETISTEGSTMSRAGVVEDSIRAYGTKKDGVIVPHTSSQERVAPPGWTGMSRKDREQAEESVLAPGATRARGAGKRAAEEEPDTLRTCFERDLDRVKHATVFRRLAGKCQVFLAPDNIHLRTRMTHTIEVAQVAVGCARTIGLNLALVEASALAHDCGHGPGGHASEDAFAAYVPGGFDHAIWGADVALVDLNLCEETLDAVRQHSWRLGPGATPEAELVSVADRVAYLAHDTDDAVRAGLFSPYELPLVVRETLGLTQSEQLRAMMNGVIGAVQVSGRIGVTLEVASAMEEWRRFNYDRIYLRPEGRTQHDRVVAMLSQLVEWYAQDSARLTHQGQSLSGDAVHDAVRYVAGMTDHYAIAQAHELLGWKSEALPQGVD